jgi:hypothetical protein
MGRGGRTSIKGVHAATNRHERPQFTFALKFAVVEHYIETGDIRTTIHRYFPNVDANGYKNAAKRIYKWKKNHAATSEAVKNVRTASHSRHRPLGVGTVLNSEEESVLVEWINDLRGDGVPISSTLLRLQALEVAEAAGIPRGDFVASVTWQASFLSRHKLSFRARTRAGQTSPSADALVGVQFAAEVRAQRSSTRSLRSTTPIRQLSFSKCYRRPLSTSVDREQCG